MVSKLLDRYLDKWGAGIQTAGCKYRSDEMVFSFFYFRIFTIIERKPKCRGMDPFQQALSQGTDGHREVYWPSNIVYFFLLIDSYST